MDASWPVTYSLDADFESLAFQLKDEGDRWIARPLGALLGNHLDRHLGHLEFAIGPVDLIARVPSHPDTRRGFDHVHEVLTATASPVVERLYEPGAIAKISSDSRGDDRTVRPDYHVPKDSGIRGKTVLVVDDLWTSGNTMASVGQALKAVGAARVIALPLGRVLNAAWPPAQHLVNEVRRRPFEPDKCLFDRSVPRHG